MCGIIGYIGKSSAVPILMEGLIRLEYRGYDSAGIALISGEEISMKKKAGRVGALVEPVMKGMDQSATVGIAHTRWATHGEPTEVGLIREPRPSS